MDWIDNKHTDWIESKKSQLDPQIITNVENLKQTTLKTLSGESLDVELVLKKVNNMVKDFANLTNSERLDILNNMAKIMNLEPCYIDEDWDFDIDGIDCNDMWIWSFEDDLWLSRVWWNVWPISWAHFKLPNDVSWNVDIYIHTNWSIRIKWEPGGEFLGKFTFDQRKQALDVAENYLSKIN